MEVGSEEANLFPIRCGAFLLSVCINGKPTASARTKREGCRTTPVSMWLVWDTGAGVGAMAQTHSTRGDPRLGKPPFTASMALSPYTTISPGALPHMPYRRRRRRRYSSHALHRAVVHRHLVAASRLIDISDSNNTTHPPVRSHHTLRYQTLRHLLSLEWSAINTAIEALRITQPDPLTARSAPQKAGILQTATIR